jgi:photosystem II stability/assembly factor-like uncharacterized protein
MKKQLFAAALLLAPLGLYAQEATLKGAALFGSMRARHIGPAVMSGRISDIDGVNKTPKIMYVGTAGGGVWKTSNGGVTFQPIFQENTQSIGKVTIDQQHPDTVWVGTGETWVRNSVGIGTGLYRSTDAGKSWTFVGLGDSEHIGDIVVDHTNSAVVYVAAQGHLWSPNKERGVYKTTDFGKTWQQVLFVNENTGATDLAIDPKNPNVIYASMWEHRRSPDFFSSGGVGSGLYKSTDGGKTWAKIHNGFPKGNLGRIAIDLAPSKPEVLYATVEAESKDEKGLYRSNDGGNNWTRMGNEFNLTVRPFYFSRLTIDPKNDSLIYKAGLNMIVSKDAGKSFRQMGSGMHSDMHAVWINPQNTEQMYVGTDGGVYRSLDGGYFFDHLQNLPVSQFYHVSVDNAEPYNVYGGLQDNGSWYGPSRSGGGIENRDWNEVYGGDGFWVFPHPTDKDIIFAEYQGGNLVRHNRKTGETKEIRPLRQTGEPKLRFNWNTPIHLSRKNPKKMYFGAQFLYMTTDMGDSWTKISPDLTTNDPKRQRQEQSGGLSKDNSGAENNTTIYTISESPLDENMIWVGADDGNVQLTTSAFSMLKLWPLYFDKEVSFHLSTPFSFMI